MFFADFIPVAVKGVEVCLRAEAKQAQRKDRRP